MDHPGNALSLLRNVLLAGVVVAAAAPAAAQDRLAELELRIEDDEAAAERWWWSWLGINAGFAIGEGIWAAVTDDPGIRVDQIIGSISAVIGVAMLLIAPPPALQGPNELREHEGEPRERRLERAEAIVRRNAEGQHQAHSVLSHVLCLAYALLSGAVLWLGWDRPLAGAVQAGGVIAVGELQILTAPTGSIDFLGE